MEVKNPLADFGRRQDHRPRPLRPGAETTTQVRKIKQLDGNLPDTGKAIICASHGSITRCADSIRLLARERAHLGDAVVSHQLRLGGSSRITSNTPAFSKPTIPQRIDEVHLLPPRPDRRSNGALDPAAHSPTRLDRRDH